MPIMRLPDCDQTRSAPFNRGALSYLAALRASAANTPPSRTCGQTAGANPNPCTPARVSSPRPGRSSAEAPISNGERHAARSVLSLPGVRLTRSWWDDDFGYPIMLGSGSMHDLRDADAEPKLWRCKSVSRAAAIALNHDKLTTTSGPLGFRTGRTR